MKKEQEFALWFKEISIKDVPSVGGKNASLGEMYSELTQKGINIPDGFALTSDAFWYYLKFNEIPEKLKGIFRKFNPKSIKSLQETGKQARNLILKSEFPEDLKREIIKSYKKLSQKYGQENVDVAVRSSGVAEDSPTASFAGQFETFLNISGKENLLKAIKKCLASTFNDRVIAYREEKGFPRLKFALSVGIQKMVRSDLASSGIIFTLDTETGFSNVVLINSIFGVGEMIVKGKITPDEFYVFKPTLKQGFQSIIVKNLGRKTKKYIYALDGGLKEVNVPKKDQMRFSLTDKEVLILAKWACQIEEHYGTPQDVEWAKDGITGQLFIVQSRPETIHTPKETKFYEEYQIKAKKAPILTGIAIGNKIGQGKVHIIENVSKIGEFQKGEVLVTKMTDPDWVAAFPLASGIVTDEGGKTCFSGDTKVLTNEGFLPLEEIYKKYNSKKLERLKTISFDANQNRIVWRSITHIYKRKAKTYKIVISPTLRTTQNFLEVTPDHEFLTLENRKLIKKQISSIASENKGVLTSQFIPKFSNHNFDPKENYLLGALFSDGSTFISKQGNYIVNFSQKLVSQKKKFIGIVNLYFKTIFGKEFKLNLNRQTNQGNFICNNKELFQKIRQRRENLILNTLSMDEENLLAFLDGVLDGDGNVSDHQIQITVGEEKILEAIVITSLRLGFSPSICKRKNWWVVSFDKKFTPNLLSFTQRINKDFVNSDQGHTKKFISSQVIGDIINLINQRGRMKHDYLVQPNMITDYKIKKSVLPKIDKSLKEEFKRILDSPFSMQKVKFLSNRKIKQDVYNITVKADNDLNHNYVVFTKNYTPVFVANCHAAIVSRELGIPCVVGARTATKVLKTGEVITVDCTSGSEGKIFLGKIPYEIKKYNLKKIPKLKTKIMINIGAPDIAFKTSFLPNDGVGLARIEFILAEKIRIHPLALYHYKKIKDKKVKTEIEKLTVGYNDKKQYFIDKLAEGISQIASAFYPKPVIVRLSDFKTNEYAALIGGKIFEPEESNPMLGWRGASRYYDEKFRPAFEMECQALKKAREVFGLKNIWAMIPFCRTVEEGKKVLDLMAKNGLKRGEDGLKVIVMCEIPSNVILADKFLEIFDGMSIGSNDLTQLVLGLDRDNAHISYIGDERNEAVKEMIRKVIKLCNQKKKYCGICGQAPSDYIEFAQFLMKEGIESMSLNPDTVIKTILRLSKKKQ